jgi:hypothetical protein
MPVTALGWRSHSGWAVLVVVRGSAAVPEVIDRRRVELINESLPRQPYHAVVERSLGLSDARDLIARVEQAALKAAVAATRSARRDFAVESVAVVGRARNIPTDLTRILTSHALLHAAEGDLYEQALIGGATRAKLPVFVVEPDQIEIGPLLAAAGTTLGPPWQKDHKLATAAALAALG